MTRRRNSIGRIATVAVAVGLAAVNAVIGLGTVDSARATDSQETFTVEEGRFAGLEVTVSQTKNLVDQVIAIDWEGAAPTGGSMNFSYNYLQIMQCWGGENGPDREQCQFGGISGTEIRGGQNAYKRQINQPAVDPDEPLTPSGPNQTVCVPFRPVAGDTYTGCGTSKYFDQSTTNEVPFALTRPDGTGQIFFNVQTERAAPGLGCGEPLTVDGVTKGRSCWLVIVPRDDREVDGSQATVSTRLASSPLSTSNWEHRLKIPLEFEPGGKPCAIGGAERKTVGQENVAEAVLRWQRALCKDGGAVYGYSQVSDTTARRVLNGTNPGIVFVSEPAKSTDPKKSVIHAPVAISGLTFAFNVDSRAPGNAPAALKERDGRRIREMKLTPRLVAKLLTQTYSRAVHPSADSVKGNPTDLTKDKEFLALNPQFDGLVVSLPELLVPLSQADVTENLWRWIQSDPEAAAFMAGTADQWGTKINPNYLGMSIPRPDFPKSDPFCLTYPNDSQGKSPQCTLDLSPYAGDFRNAASSAARGDTLELGEWSMGNPDPREPTPGQWKKGANQADGARAMIAVVDTASAQRYGLETAEVRNAAGSFVAPTTASMQAATTAMVPTSDDAVKRIDVASSLANAYPLTNVTYAAAIPASLDGAKRADYATFLRYAAGPGQKPGLLPGELPSGYAPLTEELRAQTLAAATALATYKDPAAKDGKKKKGDKDGEGDDSSPAPSTAAPGTTAPLPVDVAAALGAPAGDTATPVAERTGVTPTDLAGLVRFLPLVVLVLGLLAAASGPVLLRVARTRGSGVSGVT
jgi:hypothetical protein